jgi:hypothetical protein
MKLPVERILAVLTKKEFCTPSLYKLKLFSHQNTSMETMNSHQLNFFLELIYYHIVIIQRMKTFFDEAFKILDSLRANKGLKVWTNILSRIFDKFFSVP